MLGVFGIKYRYCYLYVSETMQINFSSNANILCYRYYMHGQLEQLLGTDIVGCSVNNPPLGVYRCTVDNVYNCICFSWNSKLLGHCGLIVLQDDNKAKIDCLNQYLDEKDII